MRTALVLVIVVGALGVLTAPAMGSPAATTKICGQKPGPSTSWRYAAPGLGTYRFKGATWTVFATGVRCSFALASAPGLLAQWPRAAIGKQLTLKGWLCTKEKALAYSGKGSSSGSIGCVGKSAGTIEILMLAPYTLAQIKQVAASGQLPK